MVFKVFIFQGAILLAAGLFSYFSLFRTMGFPPSLIFKFTSTGYADPPEKNVPFHPELFNLGNYHLNS